MSTEMQVGFVGLGRMGTPMAINLGRAGFPLTVWNRTADKAQAVVAETGCSVAATVAELAAASQVMVTMVADGRALEEIVLGDEAVLSNLAGKVLLDMSTTGPEFAVGFAQRLSEQGIRFVEAPVSGSTATARAGELTLLVGAAPGDLEQVRGVLGAVGRSVHHLGPPGAGGLAKLVINNLIYGINQCLSESLVLAERGGLEREAIYAAILDSAAAAPVMRYRREAFLHPGEGEVSFTLQLAEKDLHLTQGLADRLDAPMPQSALNHEIVQRAVDHGFGGDDLAIVAEYLRRISAQTATASKER